MTMLVHEAQARRRTSRTGPSCTLGGGACLRHMPTELAHTNLSSKWNRWKHRAIWWFKSIVCFLVVLSIGEFVHTDRLHSSSDPQILLKICRVIWPAMVLNHINPQQINFELIPHSRNAPSEWKKNYSYDVSVLLNRIEIFEYQAKTYSHQFPNSEPVSCSAQTVHRTVRERRA